MQICLCCTLEFASLAIQVFLVDCLPLKKVCVTVTVISDFR